MNESQLMKATKAGDINCVQALSDCPKGISFVRAGKLLNSALYPKGISFVRAGKLLNSALSKPAKPQFNRRLIQRE